MTLSTTQQPVSESVDSGDTDYAVDKNLFRVTETIPVELPESV